jgi:predicted DNA-binding transcriptional regulator AlpA
MRDTGGDAQWNVTLLDGKTITWIEDGDRRAVVSVLDPESSKPAWRVLPGGDGEQLDDAPTGLTVYGRFVAERPSFDSFPALAPAYAYLVQGIIDGRGITHRRVTEGADRLLSAEEVGAMIGVKAATVYRYHSAGTMPEADDYAGRSPRWHASTIERWKRPGRGAGGGRPPKRRTGRDL